MAYAVYLRKFNIFTVTFHIFWIRDYESIKSIDDNLYKKIVDAKFK